MSIVPSRKLPASRPPTATLERPPRMATQLTADDDRQSLTSHVAAKGAEINAKYGPRIGWKELQRILEDRSCVRYPCKVVFDAAGLQPVSYTHLRAHETDSYLVCRLL